MRTTIDKAGRVVLPKELRERVGMLAGEVDVTVDGSGLRVSPVATEHLVERGGRLVVPASSAPPLTSADVLALRDADQR